MLTTFLNDPAISGALGELITVLVAALVAWVAPVGRRALARMEAAAAVQESDGHLANILRGLESGLLQGLQGTGLIAYVRSKYPDAIAYHGPTDETLRGMADAAAKKIGVQ